MNYKLLVEESALHYLLGLPSAKRARLLNELERLATQPFERGEFSFPDSTGRPIQVKRTQGWMITFWADHAVSEIRVVELDPE